jgi:hypothetical protein
MYFAETSAPRERVTPPYRLSRAIAEGGLVHRGDHDGGSVRMHLVELAENSGDTRHFEPLHGRMKIPWTGIDIPGVTINHDASWGVDPERPWVGIFIDRAHLLWRGKSIPRSDAMATIEFLGPGSVVRFTFEVPRFGPIVMYQTQTPIAPLVQHVTFRWFAGPRVPRLMVRYVIGNWISQWREDIRIWERKAFLQKPMVIAEDGPIHPVRRWYAQFYPDLRSRPSSSAQVFDSASAPEAAAGS